MKTTIVLVLCLVTTLHAHGRTRGGGPNRSGNINPIVGTTEGQLRGSTLKSVGGKDIYSFRGIRYAEPPVGDLRFKEPVPPASWKGVRNAVEDGAACPQIWDLGPPQDSEDCLFLNVYTRKLPNRRTNPKRPVMIWFHAGGFFSLSGRSDVRGPQYLMDEDIVLVTTNYRIGALGFLSTNDSVLRGNYGMKDQVQVLRWVKRNIASFGGDPDSVTITGYSAGSISVLLHMVSPMSQGLFHRVIAMSGSPAKGLQPEDGMVKAQKLAALLNCPNDTSEEILNCLKQKDIRQIVQTLGEFREYAEDPIAVFQPIVEPDLGDGVERFLPADPVELFLAGNFSQVPLITGYTTEEFSWKALQIIGNEAWAEEMDQDFERVAPIAFGYERDTERSRYISRELRKFYLNNQPIDNSSATGLGQLYADSIVNFPEYRAAKIISSVSSAPVYYYKFSYPGRYSFVYNPPGSTTPYGVAHHDDIIYLFYISVQFPLFNTTDPEYRIMRRQTKMWRDFIHTGNPTPGTSAMMDNVRWQPFTTQNLKYLDMGSTLEMKEGLYQDRMAVWERLFPLPSTNP